MSRRALVTPEERRCSTCRRGVAQGARFTRRFPKRTHSRALRSMCTDCEATRLRVRRAQLGAAYYRPAPVARPEELTRRQREVFALAATGLVPEVIAATLGIAPSSVRNHLTIISRRLAMDPQSTRGRLEAFRAYGTPHEGKAA